MTCKISHNGNVKTKFFSKECGRNIIILIKKKKKKLDLVKKIGNCPLGKDLEMIDRLEKESLL